MPLNTLYFYFKRIDYYHIIISPVDLRIPYGVGYGLSELNPPHPAFI